MPVCKAEPEPKRSRQSSPPTSPACHGEAGGTDNGSFEVLPEEMVITIMAKLSSTADSPADLAAALMV
jgi:hypothetical protein